MHHFFVDPDIAKAKTIDTSVYTAAAVFEIIKQKIFSVCWQFVSHAEVMVGPGSCFPFTLLENYLDEPLLITHDKENQLHCLSNVCTHRGNILVNEPCKSAHLRCNYHGRLFKLNGSFQSMPEFKEVQNFPTADDDLRAFPLHNWKNFLFTTLKPFLPAEEIFREMENRIGWMPIEKFAFKPEYTKLYNVHANWALYCENYLEGFHIPFVHADLNAVIDYGNYTTEIFRYSNLQLGVAKDGEDCFDLPASSTDFGKKIAAYYFWVFPNMMFNFYPWGLSLNIVKPKAVDKTEVIFLSYVWDQSKYNSGAGGSLDKVEKEDEAIVENVQKGVRSQYYNHGRYSVSREQGTHHFHRLLCEFLNT